jgi:DNA polymerase-3 subunit delta'
VSGTSFRLIGHREAVALLRHGLAAERVSHAYLLTGPRGVGRRTLAIQLAQALNCTGATGGDRPCGECRQCRLIQRGVHPDVRVVRRAPERRAILLRAPNPAGPPRPFLDNVESIQADAQLRPADGRKKVYIVLNAEELAEEAANRLLKTIEEPTPFVHFVLTASDRGAVLPTIASRCQELRLRTVPRADLARALVEVGAADLERAAELAALAAGCPGWALAAAHDASALRQRAEDVGELHAALGASRLERLVQARALAERWWSNPERMRTLLRAWLAWWRDVLLVQLGLEARIAHIQPTERAALERAGASIPLSAVRAAQAQARQTLEDLDANVNARLTLDLLLLRLPELASLAGSGARVQSARRRLVEATPNPDPEP